MCGGAPSPPPPPPPPEPLPPAPQPVDSATAEKRARSKRTAATARGLTAKRSTTPLGLTDDNLNSTKKTALGV